MLVVMRFEVPEAASEQFAAAATTALATLAARAGYLQGRIGRAPDDPTAWVVTTEWTGVGAYRRSLSPYDVKVALAPLMPYSRNEVSAYELVASEPVLRDPGRATGTP